MLVLPPDGRILFAVRDRAEFGFLSGTHVAEFEFEGARWPSLAAWAEARRAHPTELRDALRAQYAQHPELCRALLATGEHELVDDAANGEASFVLGAMRMALRSELRRAPAAPDRESGFLDELLAGLGWFSP